MEHPTRLSHPDALRGLAFILVAGVHSHGYAFLGDEIAPGSFEPSWTMISGSAVPIFFFVDGSLTARSQNRTTAPRLDEVVRKIARRLLIPWLIFILNIIIC